MEAIVKQQIYFVKIAFRGIPTAVVPVQFADEASKLLCEVRDRNGFGVSDMKSGCGDLMDAEHCIVGRISYNGRVWNADGQAIS